jgi:hypothetical protein
MKIRFKTKDGLVAIKECPDIEKGDNFSSVMSPMWTGAPTPDGKKPELFGEYRHYEFRGEVEHGIPTVHES